MKRRTALKVLGTIPIAASVVPALARAQRAMSPTLGDGLGSFTPRFFTTHEWQTVRLLADYVIPRDEQSGSATDAKVPEYMDLILAETDNGDRSAIRWGLRWLDIESVRRFGHRFVNATDAQRKQVLDDIAWPRKQNGVDRVTRAWRHYGVVFFNTFRDMTASGFFSSEMGWRDLGYMGHMQEPTWNGCPPDALRKLGVDYSLMRTRVAPFQRGVT
jgi:hypothetical protein